MTSAWCRLFLYFTAGKKPEKHSCISIFIYIQLKTIFPNLTKLKGKVVTIEIFPLIIGRESPLKILKTFFQNPEGSNYLRDKAENQISVSLKQSYFFHKKTHRIFPTVSER